MNRFLAYYLFCLLLFTACSHGQLKVICQTESDLKEISAVEYDSKHKVFWVIQDSGNSNELIAINDQGKTTHRLKLKDTKNKDWEDLTIDAKGNLYIGDFGNNDKQRNTYKIYKVKESDLNQLHVQPELIAFKLPKDSNEKNFEGYFLFKNHFYLFTKEEGKTAVYKVPNEQGEHKAKKIGSHKFHEKQSKVTSAAISMDGSTVVLLNHYRLWKLSDFSGDDFFSGSIEKLDLKHSSQKEGIGFFGLNKVVITDERSAWVGGNIYSFDID
ncbi:SdiA-regulated domain-containing protein [Winogradskyella aurantiaca]|uniref:SdiA-regulated domain-containing protein n=1 Tax=Winogradskyella aurantiaca TaxID=2219558 RepID=UPI000E1CE07C|nr:SdiA-regulated domain-containing protein [Winogradskyella aurantiaca]